MIIKAKVFTNCRREEIIKISNDSYKIYLKKPAHDNKANIEIIKLLKKHFNSSVRIIKGEKNKEKILEVTHGN
jgi:uncharacterized protein (TIGR00251 family)